jgi:DIS3-like exonuclease 2
LGLNRNSTNMETGGQNKGKGGNRKNRASTKGKGEHVAKGPDSQHKRSAGGKGKHNNNNNNSHGGRGRGGGKGKQGGRGGSKGASRFPEHWSEQYVQALVAEGALLSGPLRINAKRTQEAYVKVAGIPHDCLIESYVNRNRAFGGDTVAIRLLGRRTWRPRDGAKVDLSTMPESETPEELLAHAQTGELQAQAVVVALLEAPRKTIYIGTLIPFKENANFVPSDTAVSRFFVSGSECPAGWKEDQKMYSCTFTAWGSSDPLPKGTLGDSLTPTTLSLLCVREQCLCALRQSCGCLGDFVGEFGDIESETEALIIRHEVDAAPFDEAILLQLRERYPEDWTIPEEEIANRRDLRTECIFAIDPPTAKDLDDALQCERLPNGNFKVRQASAQMGRLGDWVWIGCVAAGGSAYCRRELLH